MSFRSILYLEEGWNLVSFFQKNINFKTFTNNPNIIEIKNLNESYNKNIPLQLNSLKEIKINSGYWINSSQSFFIEISGSLDKNDTNILLKKGWNLIGYPYQFSFNVKKISNSNILEIKNILASYNSNIPNELNTLSKLSSHEGYWVKVKEDTNMSLKYPFIYNYKDENNNINGLVAFDEILIEDINKNYLKENYKLDLTQNTVVDIPWVSENKNIDYEEIHEISRKLKEIRFSVYYGKINNVISSVAINFLDDFPVQKDNIGKIKINPKTFNENKKYIEIYFDDIKNKILINLTNNNLVFTNNGSYGFIKNLSFTNIELFTENNNFSSYFMNDFYLEKIIIKDVTIKKNNNLLKLKTLKSDYDIIKDRLVLNLVTETNIPFIVYINSLEDYHKNMLLNIVIGDDNKINDNESIIIQNKDFQIINNDNTYQFVISWAGPLKSTSIYKPSLFEPNTQYLYWYNLNNITFQNIYVNDIDYVLKYKKIDSNQDYNIFEIKSNNQVLIFYLIKSKFFPGCIDVTIGYKSLNDENYNFENRYFNTVSIYNNFKFKIGLYEIAIKWIGQSSNIGFSLNTTQIKKQREFANFLNTYEIIKFPNISFKIHYYIGFDDNSIDLKIWRSYNNFILTLKELLSFAIDYLNLYKLELPLTDGNLEKNGGDPNYDIYFTNIENKYVKGYTKADCLCFDTVNPNDVNSYINIASDLNYEWLKTVLFHELFHAVQGSYDWFEKSWISEGLAVVFEYILNNNNSLSTKYFIQDLLNDRYQSIGNVCNVKITSDGYITTINSNNQNRILGKVAIEIESLFSDEEEIIITDKIPDVKITSTNNNSIYIDQVNIIRKNNKNILRIVLDSNRSSRTMGFYLYVNHKKINKIICKNSTRAYGTFTFFYYLIEKYGKIFFGTILKNSLNYSNYNLLDKTIKDLNSSSSFINELSNFWCAVEIASNSTNVNQEYRLSKINSWKKYYNVSKNVLLNGREILKVNNLENTGCRVIDLIFNEKIILVKFDGKFKKEELFKKLIIEYQDRKIDVIDIGNINEFKLEGNSYVYRYKLVLIAGTNFEDNVDIFINLANVQDNYISDLMEFKINVLKN